MAVERPDAIWQEGILRSGRFGDRYFSDSGGLGETRAVFLEGCGLPHGWAGRRQFTVAELGLGTGLNMLAALELWSRTRPGGGRLNLFSVEGFPLDPDDAARAIAAFPEVAPFAGPLLRNWPRRPGFHRIDWPELGASLDLAVMDASEALSQWDGRADAWFLDGFAPAVNPAMWSAELMRQVASRSRPGCRLATYSVAGLVRRGLEAAGFQVEKKPGFGSKRQRLEARIPGEFSEATSPSVAIVGAGIAGQSLARALRAEGIEARVFAQGPMASGHPAALISPRIAEGAAGRLHRQAFDRSVQLVRDSTAEAIIATGAVRQSRSDKEQRRLLSAVEALWPDLKPLSPQDIAQLLDEPESRPGLWQADALVVEPAAIAAQWLPAEPRNVAISKLERKDDGWHLLDTDGVSLGRADILFIAAGLGSGALSGLPLTPVRGQLSLCDLPFTGLPASDGHYAIPTRTGSLFGATHDKGDDQAGVRPADDAHNLLRLGRIRPRLAERIARQAVRGVAGVRVLGPSSLPLAGQLAPGLFLLAGFGGRGFALAPLLAEHVVARALGRPSPLPQELSALVRPTAAPEQSLAPPAFPEQAAG